MNNFWTTFNDGHGPDLEVGKLRREGPWHAIEVCLQAGAKYRPGRNQQPCQIIILEGSGSLEITGQTTLYVEDSIIYVPDGAMHCFSWVRTKTIFTKRWQPTGEQKAKIEKMAKCFVNHLLTSSAEIIPFHDFQSRS